MFGGVNIDYQWTPYLIITGIMLLVTLGLAVSNIKNRNARGARYFLIILALVFVWVLAQGVEISALKLETKLFWANLQYIPIMLIPIIYLYFSLYFMGKDRWLNHRLLKYLLLIVPVAMNVLLWTEKVFHFELMRKNVYLKNDGVLITVAKDFGPIFWIFAAYNFLLTIYTLTLLFREMKDKTFLYRKQVIFIFYGLLIPTFVTALHMFGFGWHNVDLTPASFGITALILSFGIYEYGLFDLIPMAQTMIIQNMSIGMIVIDNKHRLIDINPAAAKILKIEKAKQIGCSVVAGLRKIEKLAELVEKEVDQKSEICIENEEWIHYYEVTMNSVADSRLARLGWLIQLYDITERKRAEEIASHAALHDSLTGLPNRICFQNMLKNEIEKSKAIEDGIGVAFIDLDDFKGINDLYGHLVGDRVLFEVAQRLRQCIRETDFLGRVGGDEFVLGLPNTDSKDKMKIVGNKILKGFKEAFLIDEKEIYISLSIGFSYFPEDGKETEVLFRKADSAMYRVKTVKKADFQIYKEHYHEQSE